MKRFMFLTVFGLTCSILRADYDCYYEKSRSCEDSLGPNSSFDYCSGSCDAQEYGCSDPPAQNGWLDLDDDYSTEVTMTFIVDGGWGDPTTGHNRDSSKETEWIDCYTSGNCYCNTEFFPMCDREPGGGGTAQLSYYPLDTTTTCPEEIVMAIDASIFD